MRQPLLVTNKTAAMHNRTRIRQGIGREFYDGQIVLMRFWQLSTPPPHGLIVASELRPATPHAQFTSRDEET